MSSADDTERSWQLALAIALHLPPGWRATRREGWYWAELHRDSDGAGISVSVGGHRTPGRVVFRGQPPKYRNGQTRYFDRRHMEHLKDDRTFEITCRADRKPAALAAEIARRLLAGGYDSLWAEYSEAVRRSDAHDEDADAVAERLAGVVGGQVQDSKSRTDSSVHIAHRVDAVSRLRVFPAYDSSLGGRPVRVDFEVHGLDPETAARVLEVIQEAERAQAEEADRVRVAESGPAIRVAEEVEDGTDESEEPEEASRAATPMS